MERNRNEKNTEVLNSNNPFVKAPVDLFGAAPRPVDPRSLFADKVAADPHAVSADAPEGSYTYALVKSGPEVSAEECERAEEAVEIMVLWGDSITKSAFSSPT